MRERERGGEKIPDRIEKIGPTSYTRRQEKNSRMDTSSRTKSVERPVRAVDLFIASLDALTLLEGSSTLSAQIDSDERATLLASFGRFAEQATNGGAGGEIRGFARERKKRLVESRLEEERGSLQRERIREKKRKGKKEKTS